MNTFYLIAIKNSKTTKLEEKYTELRKEIYVENLYRTHKHKEQNHDRKSKLKKKHREFKIIQANKKYFDTVKVESINTRLKYHHHFPKTAFCENEKKKKKHYI